MAAALVFKIEGMDCAEEIATLKGALSPLVGGEEYLFFDLLNGKLSIKKQNSSISQGEIIAAVAKTGMKASPWGEPQEERSFYERNAKSIFTSLGSACSI